MESPSKTIVIDRLDINRDNELLQRFVRVNIDDSDATESDELPRPKQAQKPELPNHESVDKEEIARIAFMQQQQQMERQQNIQSAQSRKVARTREINLELKKRKKRRRKKSKNEEIYTDKDRAAAVNMGSKDIKQSLKIKRKEDRTKALQIPEEAEPGSFLALGNYKMCRGNLQNALDFMTKALELNPTEKNCLVARSKCYILLGQPENALKDAESALTIDKSFIKGIYQKAESLYYLGDFEHSLMYYHRGLRLRPDHEGFHLGVRKAQKAIENAIGLFPAKSSGSKASTAKSKISDNVEVQSEKNSLEEGASEELSQGRTSGTPISSSLRSTTLMRGKTARKSRLLRELAVDKEYLDNLLKNPDIKCKHKQDDSQVVGHIQEAIDFLNTREEFWRQQLPPSLK